MSRYESYRDDHDRSSRERDSFGGRSSRDRESFGRSSRERESGRGAGGREYYGRSPSRDSYSREREDAGRQSFRNDGRSEVLEAPMPGDWMPVRESGESGLPSWDPSCLLQEPRPEGWTPPTPEPVPITLMPFKEAFDREMPEPPRFKIDVKESFLSNDRIGRDEPLIVFNNSCVVRTTLDGIEESKKQRAIEDEENEREFGGGFRGRGGRGRGRGGDRGGGRGGRGGASDRGGFDPNRQPLGERRKFGGDDRDRSFNERDRRPSDRDRSPRGYSGARNLETHERGERRPSRDETPNRRPSEYSRNSPGLSQDSRYGGYSQSPRTSEARNDRSFSSSTPGRSGAGSSDTPGRGSSAAAGSYAEWKAKRAAEKAAGR